MIICVENDDLEPGEYIEGFITDKDRDWHYGAMQVLRVASKQEYIDFCSSHGIDENTLDFSRSMTFYEVSID